VRCLAFVGSGLSSAPPSEISTWRNTFEHLCAYCRDLGLKDIADKQRRIAKTAEYQPRFLTQCFEELRTAMGKSAYESAMKSILSPKKPGIPDAVDRVASIPFHGVITTNVDELIEKAAERVYKRGERPSTLKAYVSSDGQIQGALARKFDWVWKIHGTIERPETWIFTATDYASSIYSNRKYREALKAVVEGARLVFLGFGGSDPDIEQLLWQLSELFGGRADPHIMITRSRRGLDLVRLGNNNIRVVEYGGPKDHSALLEILDEFPHFHTTGQAGKGFDDSAYRAWLASETDYIDVRGVGGRKEKGVEGAHFPILELYTQLYARGKATNLQLENAPIRGGERIELTEMATSVRCLAVNGDPGSGKTTFLRYLARKQLLDGNSPLPFYLQLGDVHEYFMKREGSKRGIPSPDVFVDFLLDLSSHFGLGFTKIGLEARLRGEGGLFLLDSLDEVPSDEDRELVIRAIEQAANLWKKCKFILTSRPWAMVGKSIPIGFEIVNIDQLADNEIHFFLDAWTRLLFPGTSEDMRQRHCDSLLSIINERPEIRTLAKNPVMLTSIAVIHYNGKHLPEGRADLLEAVIEWLIRAKKRSLESGRMPSRFTEERFRELALAMFSVEGRRVSKVGRRWALSRIVEHFGGDEEKASEFLRREESETGVLVHRGAGDVAFWHPSFQEYLAAKEIAGKTDEEELGWWHLLKHNLDKMEWREVVCLVPQCLIRLGSDRVDLFLDRLGSSCIHSELKVKARRVGLGGRILRDLRMYEYEPASVPAWSRVLSEVRPIFEAVGEEIPIEDRYNAGAALGLGRDYRLRDFEYTWARLPGGPFLMGAQADDESSPCFDPDAVEWEGPVVEVKLQPFDMRKYLITVEEYERFVSDGGYEDHDRRLWSSDGLEWRLKYNIHAPKDWEEQTGFPNFPVTGVSWYEAEAYCRWLTSGDPRRLYHLPSEAEWEYAARRGLSPRQRFSWGDSLAEGEKAEANWAGCGLREKTPVGMFPKSTTADGIADMIGNVEEWCADTWRSTHRGYHRNGRPRNLPRDEVGRVVRGGSTIRAARLCRPTYRSRCNMHGRYQTIGFRPVRKERR